mmetsp:Transcript_54178/g.60497  ORF Transcript_54178/g.60497 Transcript_54178/m.60497 type:complete len:560 (-) Transcript_54178:46-1725(-)
MALSKVCRWSRPFMFLLVLVLLGVLSVYYYSVEYYRYINNDRQSSLRRRLWRRKATSITTTTTTEAAVFPRPRIVGGNHSLTVPYFILWGGCGATLIHNDIALSAAHCSERDSAQVGLKNRTDENSRWTRVDEVRKHPRYNSESYDYDFAVLKLKGWFQETVQLNVNKESPRVGESLKILGFGGQNQTLKQGQVVSISSSICAEQWLRAGYFIDEDAVLCAKADDGVDACSGDSGGPLLLLDGSSIQVGVISSGSGCDGRLPTVYSRVSAGQDWIKQQICELSAFPPEFCDPSDRRPGLRTTRIRVDINLDDYPQDIRWRITEDPVTSGEGKTIASGGNFQIPNSLESQFVDLPDNNQNYIFTIEDVSGFADGFGNNGKYKVVIVDMNGSDADTLVSGGNNFQDSESTLFTVSDAMDSTFSRPVILQNDPNQIDQPTSTLTPSWSPTDPPTKISTEIPTEAPTKTPVTSAPTATPETSEPTSEPTVALIDIDTPPPTAETNAPTPDPTTPETTSEPTTVPTADPTSDPTADPTAEPTVPDPETSEPTTDPTLDPTAEPT